MLHGLASCLGHLSVFCHPCLYGQCHDRSGELHVIGADCSSSFDNFRSSMLYPPNNWVHDSSSIVTAEKCVVKPSSFLI
jgi:hypothetical protein